MRFLKQFSLMLALVSVAAGADSAGSREEDFQALYDEWNDYILDGNGRLGDAIWLSSRGDTAHALRLAKMLEQQVGFGTWLAEMVARADYPKAPHNPTNRLYRDARLLRFVAGIDLISPDGIRTPREHHALNFREILEKNQAQFAAEWLAGGYSRPEHKVAQACEQADETNGEGAVAPGSLPAIRRFGLFGLPELAAQVKKRNSRAAFASFLIITGESDEYREYINRPAECYVTTESKVERMRDWLDRKRADSVSGDGAELFERMERALAGMQGGKR